MEQVSYWLHQFDNTSESAALKTYDDVAALVNAQPVPAGWGRGLMVKAHSGSSWQARFDEHTLAISGEESLAALSAACGRAGINLGAWGEARGNFQLSGALAGQSARATGYYCLDLEPYSDFGYPLPTEVGVATAALAAVDFWRSFRAVVGEVQCGVSIAPQRSGIEPFGDITLACWLYPCDYIHTQNYVSMNTDLEPITALAYLETVLPPLSLRRPIIPIVEPAMLDRIAADPRWQDGIDVWRL